MNKHRRVLHVVMAAGLLLVILVMSALLALHSRAFHRFILGQIDERASKATGARVEVGDFQFWLSGLRVDLYQTVVHGSESSARPPLFQADRLRVGLKIISLWRRKFDVSEIVLDRPSLHVSADQNGRTNLPASRPASPGSQPTNIFDLAIGHFVVNNGELNYADRHIPLEAAVYDLQAHVNFNPARTEYDGTLGYDDGNIHFGTFGTVQHGLQLSFGATASGLAVNSLVLNVGSSKLSVYGNVRNYSDPSVEGSYQADLSTTEIGHLLKAASIPAGRLELQGTLKYMNRTDRPLLDNLTVDGHLHSPLLALNLTQARAGVRELSGDYHLSDGSLEARNVQGNVLGGKASGELTLTNLLAQPAARVAATVRNISLEAVSNALDTRPLKGTAISGRLNGTMTGSWVGSGENLQLHSDAKIAASAPLQQTSGNGTNPIPVQGDLHLAYDGRSGMIMVRHSVLSTPHLSANVDGSTGKKSSLSLQVQSDDLREVDQLVVTARHVMAGSHPPSRTAIEPLGIAGSASLVGQLSGAANNLRLAAQLSSSNLQYRGTTLSDLRTELVLSPSQATLSQGRLQTSDQGQVQFDVAVGLENWAYKPQSSLRVDLNAAKLHVGTLERMADIHYPISGTLGGQVALHGSQSNLSGQGNLTLAHATAWNQPIQNLSVQFQGAGSSIHTTVQVAVPAGSGSGKLSYDFRNQGYDAQFSLPRIQLEKLAALKQGKVQVGGVVALGIEGRGALKDPQLTATLQAPKLLIGQQSLDGFNLQANVAHQRATFTLQSAAVGASVQAQGAVALTANYDATATLNINGVQLGPLLAAFVPQAPAGLQGQAELHGSLHGPLKLPKQVQAQVEIPKLNVAYQNLQIGNATPIRAVYREGVISLDQCKLHGTGTDLQVQAAVPIERLQSLQAAVNGNVDLHLMQLMYPGWNTSGQIRLEASARGTFAKPAVQGTVRVVDADIEPPGAPLGVQKLNATFALQTDRVDIQNFKGEAGGGKISAQGFATFQPTLQFNVKMTAKTVRLRYPVGTRAILDSQLLLTGSRDSSLLTGQVLIDRLSLTKEFDVSKFADQFTGNSAAATSTSFAQNVKLNVAVNSASEMAVSSSKLSVQGSVNLRVRGTADAPVILGRTDITEGEIFFNGQRFTVQDGVVQFVNVAQTEPVVNLHVTTTVDQFNLTVNLVGPIDRLRITYASDPPLAPIDIINLLATGRTTEAASANPSTPESVIAGQLTSQFSNRVEKLAGISSLTIDPQVGSGQGNGSGTLAIQQRVTKNLFFTFSTNLTTTTGEVVQVEYQVTRRFAVSTLRDQNGGYTVQVKVHKSF